MKVEAGNAIADHCVRGFYHHTSGHDFRTVTIAKGKKEPRVNSRFAFNSVAYIIRLAQLFLKVGTFMLPINKGCPMFSNLLFAANIHSQIYFGDRKQTEFSLIASVDFYPV